MAIGNFEWRCERCGAVGYTKDGDIPQGWSSGGNSVYGLLCHRCAVKVADESEAEEKAKREYYRTPEGKRESTASCISLILGPFLGLVAVMLSGSLILGAILLLVGIYIPWIFMGSRVSKKSKKKIRLGCLLIVLFCALFLLFAVSNSNSSNSNSTVNSVTPSQKESSQPISKETAKNKLPAYLNGLDDIEFSGLLSTYYSNIAGEFHYGNMGLTGSPEQIRAGNKLMETIYVFLGDAAWNKLKKTNKKINIDSMKVVVKNFVGVSEFRKKKALEELQLGVDKIRSVK